MCGVPHHARNAYLSRADPAGVQRWPSCDRSRSQDRGDLPPGGDRGGHPGLVFTRSASTPGETTSWPPSGRPHPFVACAALRRHQPGNFSTRRATPRRRWRTPCSGSPPAVVRRARGARGTRTDARTRAEAASRGEAAHRCSPRRPSRRFRLRPGSGGFPPRTHPSGIVVRAALYYLFPAPAGRLSAIGRVTEREGGATSAMDRDLAPCARWRSAYRPCRGAEEGPFSGRWTARGPRWGPACCAPGSPLLCSMSSGIGERHQTRWRSSSRRHAIRKSLSPPLDAMGDLSRLASRPGAGSFRP